MNSPAVSTVAPQGGLVARAQVRALFASKIRELYNEGIGNPDILPFWVGEPDEPTPEFIRRAGTEAIAEGDTFYTHNLGIPPLREELGQRTGLEESQWLSIMSRSFRSVCISA